MQPNEIKLLQLDVLGKLIQESCPPATAGMFTQLVQDHYVLLHIGAGLLDSEEYQRLMRTPIDKASPYDLSIGPKWSALRQLVKGDP